MDLTSEEIELIEKYRAKEKEALDKQVALSLLPERDFTVSRCLDAYVKHYAVVRARTEEEARKILSTEGESLFDLNAEGEVQTFDSVDYFVEYS